MARPHSAARRVETIRDEGRDIVERAEDARPSRCARVDPDRFKLEYAHRIAARRPYFTLDSPLTPCGTLMSHRLPAD
jgi:hypothetical protein